MEITIHLNSVRECARPPLVLNSAMSDQNATMSDQPPHFSDICQITFQQL